MPPSTQISAVGPERRNRPNGRWIATSRPSKVTVLRSDVKSPRSLTVTRSNPSLQIFEKLNGCGSSVPAPVNRSTPNCPGMALKDSPTGDIVTAGALNICDLVSITRAHFIGKQHPYVCCQSRHGEKASIQPRWIAHRERFHDEEEMESASREQSSRGFVCPSPKVIGDEGCD